MTYLCFFSLALALNFTIITRFLHISWEKNMFRWTISLFYKWGFSSFSSIFHLSLVLLKARWKSWKWCLREQVKLPAWSISTSVASVRKKHEIDYGRFARSCCDSLTPSLCKAHIILIVILHQELHQICSIWWRTSEISQVSVSRFSCYVLLMCPHSC